MTLIAKATKEGLDQNLLLCLHTVKFCSKILNASCMPKKALTNSADPNQTASSEAVRSGSALFDILVPESC